jgi:hypothetical protein
LLDGNRHPAKINEESYQSENVVVSGQPLLGYQ